MNYPSEEQEADQFFHLVPMKTKKINRPFTKDEVFELNEWIREKHGTYEDWIHQRREYRDFSPSASEANEINSRNREDK